MIFFKYLTKYMNFLKLHLKEVFVQLTLPGFKCLVDSNLSIWQRFLLIVIMTFAVGITIINMMNAWNYSKENYTITNIETLQYPLWNLTFPAVYICNMNRISLHALNHVLDQWKLPEGMTRDEVMKEMRTLPVAAFKMLKPDNYDLLYKLLKMNNVSLIPLMRELAGPCSDLVKECWWLKRQYPCEMLVEKVVTVDGFCCAFNAIYYRNFSLEFHWKKARRATTCGYSDSLYFKLENNHTDYFSSLSAFYGITVYLKNPFLYPDSSEIGKVIPPDTVYLLSFFAKKIYTTDAVKELPEEYRDCFGTEQRLLAGFQAYSYHNCSAECRINLTYSVCGCIPLIYPKTAANQKRCQIDDIPCLDKYRAVFQAVYHGIFLSNQKNFELNERLPFSDNNFVRRPCDCLPECSITTYEADSGFSPLIRSDQHKDINTSSSERNVTISINKIYVFNDDVVSTRIRRDTFYTWSALLGTYGGLLGFFLGFSIICIPELFYFLILNPIFVALKRIICKINNDEDNNSSVQTIFVTDSENNYEMDYQYTSNVERFNNRVKKILNKKNTVNTKSSSFYQE